jgi:hypothetical protein
LFDPKRAGCLLLPRWEMLGEYLYCIQQTPLTRYERLRCYLLVLKSMKIWWREMRDDVVMAIKHVLLPPTSKGYKVLSIGWNVYSALDRRLSEKNAH